MDSSRLKIFLFQLRREFLFQLDGRRLHPRGVYPGVSWFLCACIAIILWEFNSSRVAPQSSPTVFGNFGILVFCLTTLICLRSTVYTALSYSRDLQNNSATIVRCSPLSANSTLLAKLCACLAPLWMELVLFFPVAILFFAIYLPLSPLVVASAFPILFFLSLVFGSVGLAVGSMTDQPVHAVRNAKLLVYFLLFFAPVMMAVTGGALIPTLAFTAWLVLFSRQAPHRKLVLGMAWVSFILTAMATHLKVLNAKAFTFSPLNIFDSLFSRMDSSTPVWSVSAGSRIPYWWNDPSEILLPFLVYCAAGISLFIIARLRYRYAR